MDHKVENGTPDACYAIAERTAQGWQMAHPRVQQDHEPMALLAHRNERPEWAHALRTGYMPV